MLFRVIDMLFFPLDLVSYIFSLVRCIADAYKLHMYTHIPQHLLIYIYIYIWRER